MSLILSYDLLIILILLELIYLILNIYLLIFKLLINIIVNFYDIKKIYIKPLQLIFVYEMQFKDIFQYIYVIYLHKIMR
jgi:hypothetical protein